MMVSYDIITSALYTMCTRINGYSEVENTKMTPLLMLSGRTSVQYRWRVTVSLLTSCLLCIHYAYIVLYIGDAICCIYKCICTK